MKTFLKKPAIRSPSALQSNRSKHYRKRQKSKNMFRHFWQSQAEKLSGGFDPQSPLIIKFRFLEDPASSAG